MKPLSRATAIKLAALLSLLLGLYAFFQALPYLPRGAAELNQELDSPPYPVIIAAFVLAIFRIVGAYGAWNIVRWGIVVTLLVNALDGILSLPGIFFGPTLRLQVESAIGVMLMIVITVLCLWRDRKAVTA